MKLGGFWKEFLYEVWRLRQVLGVVKYEVWKLREAFGVVKCEFWRLGRHPGWQARAAVKGAH